MLQQIRISAKNLGAFALDSFCPRCAWVTRRLRNRLPFQIFPGIFSSIDAYTKRVVHGYFDAHGVPPDWLAGLGDIVGYCEPPHYSRFNAVISEHDILLTGTPDGVFVRSDGAYVIADYKTARFTGAQDELFPMYRVQLNAYALLGERCGFKPVTGLALIYMEPMTDEPVIAEDRCRGLGFEMGFTARVINVNLNTDLLDPLLARVREIHDRATPPPGRAGCKECQLVDRLVSVAVRPWTKGGASRN